MRLLLTIIDWEVPPGGQPPQPELWDLTASTPDALMPLYMSFANGTLFELKAVGDSREALDVIRGLATGAGGCVRVEQLDGSALQRSLLHQDGCECYRQGRDERAALIFIDPVPRPERFP